MPEGGRKFHFNYAQIIQWPKMDRCEENGSRYVTLM